MNHPAELTLHQYMTDAVRGDSAMTEETIQQVATDVANALRNQFGSGKKRGDFKIRMSNVGRPTCQLWYEKNKPEVAIPMPTNFMMNMMIGDIVEAVFKGLLKEAGVKYNDSEKVTLNLSTASINGSYDIVINDAVDDIKSASDWSYRNKFESYDTLAAGDGFGYVGQLAGYAKASGKRAGGWWVVNKANGHFKYVPATGLDMDAELAKIENTVKTVKENKFERCFEPVPETFRGKPTGNKVLNDGCKFCSYRFDCWDNLTERPAVKSQAKNPPTVSYIGDVIA
jgi:flagellar hook-basal body complex protein FliE